MAERFYTVEPIDVEGAPFTLEGLQSVLDKIHELWGGKPHAPKNVSPAMTLGNGACVVGVEAGRVLLMRDKEAQDIARRRAASEKEPDGRLRTFRAEATIVRVIGANRAEEVTRRNVEGEGLMGLLFQAALMVQETLGDVPECMSLDTCEVRERSLRAQISRSRSQKRTAVVHFPGNHTAPFFELASRPGEYYQLSLCVETAEPQPDAATVLAFPDLPRRA